jgi:Ca2+-binding RTX toxin-like protein
MVDLRGSRGNDVMIGPKYGGATFYGGDGDDRLIAIAATASSRHAFYGGAGNDHLQGGAGRDTLDGGTGDDSIYAGAGRNKIFAGHGNDWIEGGDSASVIHTGPGRNRVKLARGNDTLHIGTGVTQVATGGGHTHFVPLYGGVTLVEKWAAGHVYDFSAWPKPPQLVQLGDRVEFTLGLSILRVLGVPKAGHDIAAQVRWPQAGATGGEDQPFSS